MFRQGRVDYLLIKMANFWPARLALIIGLSKQSFIEIPWRVPNSTIQRCTGEYLHKPLARETRARCMGIGSDSSDGKDSFAQKPSLCISSGTVGNYSKCII